MSEALIAFAFGLLIGSFLNVCIYRWPRDLSVVRPRSHCPHCGNTIAWYDNIPVISYAALRGACRSCRSPIPLRYPLVELLTGLVFFYVVWRLGATLSSLRYCVLGAMLITLAFADLETRLLPDEFTIGGIAAGLAAAWFVPVPDSTLHAFASILDWELGPRVLSFGEALLGAVVPSASLWLGGFLFEKVRHKEGLGFGDVKMIAMIGAFLGLRGALLTVIVASIAGSVAGLAYISVTKKDMATYQLPFGTFLGFAALAVMLFGQPLINWYARLL